MLFFSIYDEKNNEVIAEKPCPNSGVTGRLWTLGRLELTLVVIVNTSFQFVFFPQGSVKTRSMFVVQ